MPRLTPITKREQVSGAALEAFDVVLSSFGEAKTIVLGALMGYYLMISCTLIATDMRPAEGTPVLPKRR